MLAGVGRDIFTKTTPAPVTTSYQHQLPKDPFLLPCFPAYFEISCPITGKTAKFSE